MALMHFELAISGPQILMPQIIHLFCVNTPVLITNDKNFISELQDPEKKRLQR